MEEHPEANEKGEVEPSPDPDGSMSGVGVQSDRHSIDGLGYTGGNEKSEDPPPDEAEDRPAG